MPSSNYTQFFRRVTSVPPVRAEIISFDKSNSGTEVTFETEIRNIKAICFTASLNSWKVHYTVSNDKVTITVTFSSTAARRCTAFVIGV